MQITRRILGLDIEEHAILAAELSVNRERYDIRHLAEFVLPENVSFDEPARLGQLLRQFLHKNRFSARNTVLGIPVKWLIAREKNIPPTKTDLLAGILKIQAEREFSLDYDDLVFDYVGQPSPVQKSSLLLVATLRRKMEQIVAAAEAAGLGVLSVTSSLLTVASAFRQARSETGCVLYIRPNCAEFLVQKDKSFTLIRHLPVNVTTPEDAKAGVNALAGEVRRLISLLPAPETKSDTEKLFLWNAANIGPEELQTFVQYFSQKVEVVDGDAGFAIKEPKRPGTAEIGRFTAAISLAVTAKKPRLLAIDFLNSRIKTKKKMADGRRILRVAVVGLAVLLSALFLIWDWHGQSKEVAALRIRLENMKEDIEGAESVLQKVSSARGWYSGRPRFLECLKELTLSFPVEARVWATSLALREGMQGIVSGKALNQESVLEVLDTLKEKDVFSDVRMLYMQDVGRGTKEISFAIGFIFVGGK